MKAIVFTEREMTPSELDRMRQGFDENSIANGVIPQDSQRFGYVVMDGEKFIGCVSGLAYKNGEYFNSWCYLTDLFVEKANRRQGIGAKLLGKLEKTVSQHGIDKIWTWTAGYEGPQFYIQQGYEIFAELENWYSSGDSRIGLRKKLMG